MDLLQAFIKYAPDDVYNGLSSLDRYNLECTHEDLEDAIAAKSRQQRNLEYALRAAKQKIEPTEAQKKHARERVDEARTALKNRLECVRDLEEGKNAFREAVRKYVDMFHRIPPSRKLLDELQDTFLTRGNWYKVRMFYQTLELEFRMMDVEVTYEFVPGRVPIVTINTAVIDIYGRFLDESWSRSPALAIAIIELVGLPYTLDLVYRDKFHKDPDVITCLKHDCLPEHTPQT